MLRMQLNQTLWQLIPTIAFPKSPFQSSGFSVFFVHHKIDYFQYYFYRNFFKQVNKLLVDIRGHLSQAKAIVKAGKLFVFQHTNISIKNPTFTHLPTSVFEDDNNDDDGDDPDVEDDDDNDDDDDGDKDDEDEDDAKKILFAWPELVPDI